MFKMDLRGMKFGRLTVTEFAFTDSKSRKNYWRCLCECGKVSVVSGANFKSGNTRSCGCLGKENRERLQEIFYLNHYEHGQSHTRLHKTWRRMKERCENKKCKDYPLYGGRGIKVCEEWKSKRGFASFAGWAIRNGYQDNLTIDRIDTNGDYEPDNCRWTNAQVQANNRRSNRMIEIDGKNKSLAEWCREYGANYFTAVYRLNHGCDPVTALTEKGRICGLKSRLGVR